MIDINVKRIDPAGGGDALFDQPRALRTKPWQWASRISPGHAAQLQNSGVRIAPSETTPKLSIRGDLPPKSAR